MVKIDTLFQTKMAKKNITFRVAHTYIAEQTPPPPSPRTKNALQIMSLAAYATD